MAPKKAPPWKIATTFDEMVLMCFVEAPVSPKASLNAAVVITPPATPVSYPKLRARVSQCNGTRSFLAGTYRKIPQKTVFYRGQNRASVHYYLELRASSKPSPRALDTQRQARSALTSKGSAVSKTHSTLGNWPKSRHSPLCGCGTE